MWPWIPAAVGAVTSLFGGKKANDYNQEAQARSEAFQKEFAQHGVSWRVADAKAAGVHPLYALGAQLPSASPLVMGDSFGPAIAEAGQSVARSISASGTKAQRQAEVLNLELLKRNIAESDARRELLNAEAALARQNAVSAKGVPVPGLDEFTALGGDFSMLSGGIPGFTPQAVSPKGATVYPQSAGDESTIAGFTPLWREFLIGDGRRIVLPGGASGDVAEVLESVSESLPLMAMVYQENINRFGPDWGSWFKNRFLSAGDELTVQDILRWLGGQMSGYQDRLTFE